MSDISQLLTSYVHSCATVSDYSIYLLARRTTVLSLSAVYFWMYVIIVVKFEEGNELQSLGHTFNK